MICPGRTLIDFREIDVGDTIQQIVDGKKITPVMLVRNKNGEQSGCEISNLENLKIGQPKNSFSQKVKCPMKLEDGTLKILMQPTFETVRPTWVDFLDAKQQP